MSRGIKVN